MAEIPDWMIPERNSPPPPNQHERPGLPQEASEGEVSELLHAIDPDCGYDEWIRAMMAVHSVTGDGGLAMFDAWSAKGSKYQGERKPPFSPEAVIAEYAGTLKAYGVLSVEGDRYAGEFPREHFRKQGISYVVARKTRSELYGELIPMMNSGRVRLLDNDRLTAQLVGLERRTTRSGRDSIDHAPGGHDDTANAVAGVIERCAARYEASPALVGTYGYTGDPWQRQRQSQSGLWGTYGRANLERMN